MRLLNGVFLLAMLGCGGAAAYNQILSARRPPVTSQPQQGANQQDHKSRTQEVNNRYVQQLMKRIAGREKEPAEKVFKNIQLPWFKAVPAGDLIDIMNGGYARALGVTCTHCHVEQDFASDTKRPKRAGREMAVMHWEINKQLGKMQNLEGKPEERYINCATCHRGAIDPRIPG
jgi:hypothetical protein